MRTESESRTSSRQHRASRFPMLKNHRRNDKAHSVKLILSIFSSHADFVRVESMQLESWSHLEFQDFTCKHGVLHIIKTDNAKTEIGRKWTDWCRKYLVDKKFTEPHHPWHNYSEQGIGELGRMVRRCMREFNAPMNRHGWCQKWKLAYPNWKTEWRYPRLFSFQISLLAGSRVVRYQRQEPSWRMDTGKVPRSEW